MWMSATLKMYFRTKEILTSLCSQQNLKKTQWLYQLRNRHASVLYRPKPAQTNGETEMFLNRTARVGKSKFLPPLHLPWISKLFFFFKWMLADLYSTGLTRKTDCRAIRKGNFDEQWWFLAMQVVSQMTSGSQTTILIPPLLHPGDIWQCLETFTVVTPGGWGEGRSLLNILCCVGQPPITENQQAPNVNSVEAERF